MVKINPDIFKIWDIRGSYPEELNEEVFRILVRAYVQLFKPEKIIIGHDPLDGSTEMYPIVCDEFSKLGVAVAQIGQVSSPMLYFATPHFNFPQGLMMTASHQGPGHTGFKALIEGVPPNPKEMENFKRIALDMNPIFEYKTEKAEIKLIENFLDIYADFVENIVEHDIKEKKYKVVIDASNGPNAPIAERLYKFMPVQYKILNDEVRGSNLAHDTNPKIEKNRKQLVDEVKNFSADFGIIWDGDGDRAYFVDWNGKIITPEFVGIQIGSYLIKKGLGSKMTVDVRGSQAVVDEIEKIGGTVKRIESWHIPIKIEMEKDKDIVFGMETSGHYVIRDIYRSDDGLLASLLFIAAIAHDQNEFKENLRKFRSKYKIVEEINFETEKTEKELVNLFKEVYADGKMTDIDGITVDYPDWRFNIRSSRSEPIIRLNISGTDFTKVDENLEKIKNLVGGKILE